MIDILLIISLTLVVWVLYGLARQAADERGNKGKALEWQDIGNGIVMYIGLIIMVGLMTLMWF